MSAQISQDDIRELMSGRDRIRRSNIEYYLENEEQLREEYGGDIIAIADAHVVHSISGGFELDDLREFIDLVQTEYEGAYVTEVPEPGQVMMY